MTPPPGAGGPPAASGGGNKTPLIIVAVVIVLALIGGGAWALTSGGDDDDDKQEEDEAGGDDEDDGDDGGDDGGDSEPLGEDDFVEAANGVCTDLEDNLSDISDDTLGDLDFDDPDPDALEEFEEQMLAAVDEGFGELEQLVPEDDPDEWQDFVSDWREVYEDLIDQIASGDLDDLGNDDLSDIEDRADDYGLECIDGGSMDPDDGSSSPGASPSPSPSPGGGSDEVGDPTPPPAFDDPSLESLGDACFEGDLEACDDLYFDSAFDSPEEEYGDTCGGRTDGGSLCALLEVRSPR